MAVAPRELPPALLRCTRIYALLVYCYLFGVAGWWRSFARLPGDLIGAPIYITDLMLLVGILLAATCLLVTGSLKIRWAMLAPASRWIFLLTGLLLCLLPLRVLPDYFDYGFKALRDGVLLAYLMFIPVFFVLARCIALRICLLVMFAGMAVDAALYYLLAVVWGVDSPFLVAETNMSLAVLPIAACYILYKRRETLARWALVLLPTSLFMVFLSKRTLALGALIVLVAITVVRPALMANTGRFLAAAALSFVLAVGLSSMPSFLGPAIADARHFLAAAGDDEIMLRGTGSEQQSSIPDSSHDYSGFRLLHGEDYLGEGLMSWRMHIWRNVWADIQQHPFWGWGFGPNIVRSLSWGPNPVTEHFVSGPHNAYLTVVYRLGVPLGVAFLAIPALFFLRAFAQRSTLTDIDLLALATIAFSYFHALLNIGFESPQYSVPAYMLMGILLAQFGSNTSSEANCQ